MRGKKLAFVDTETTGLNPFFHEVIEIGCVIAEWKTDLFGKETLEETATCDIKIIPRYIDRADPKALEVNKYHKRDWSTAVPIKAALEQFLTVARGSVFIAQNVTFDWAFLLKAAQDVGAPLDKELQIFKLDLASIAIGRYPNTPELKRYSLYELSQFFGIKNPNMHTALSDARTAFEIYKKLVGGTP